MKRNECDLIETADTSVQIPSHGTILMIAVICEYHSLRIKYRIYQEGKVIFKEVIIKNVYSIADIEDIADVVTSQYQIDTICVMTPGIVEDGRLTFHSYNIIDEEMQKRLEHRYHVRVILCNDANVMALGFACMNQQYHNICFYFHPHASGKSGVGFVINGHLYLGRNRIAGEMKYLTNVMNFSEDPIALAGTAHGSIELVSKYLTAIIACMDPEAIAVSCDMITDINDIKEELSCNIDKKYIPELIKVKRVSEYMFAGGLCLTAEH